MDEVDAHSDADAASRGRSILRLGEDRGGGYRQPRLHAFAHTGAGEGGSIPQKAVVHPRCVRLSAAYRQAL